MESLLGTDCCWLVCFLQGLLTHPLQHALWLTPAPSQNFRENIPIHRPRPSAGGALKEKRTPGALVFGSRKASLDVLQDHGVWLSRSLSFGSLAATYEGQGDCPTAPPHRELNQNQTEILRCPSPAGPRAAVGGSPLHNNFPTFAKLSRIKMLLSRARKKFRGGSQHNMNGLRN